jgi:cell division protein FtsB
MRPRWATYKNLRRRILVSVFLATVLVGIVTAAAGAQTAAAVTLADARTAIQASYAEYATARLAQDMNTSPGTFYIV